MIDEVEATVDQEDINHKRMIEAILFASEVPLSIEDIAERLPENTNVLGYVEALQQEYETRGVTLKHVADKYMFSTANDLAFLLRKEVDEQRKLSRAAVETLAIVAYHFPVTRTEIEEIRGVSISKGTLDLLMEADWVRIMGRRKTPGRPVTYGITEEFLVHFGLETIKDLPGLSELKAAGLLDTVDSALDQLIKKAEDTDEDENQLDIEDAIEQKEASKDNDLEDHSFDEEEGDDAFDDDWDDDEAERIE